MQPNGAPRYCVCGTRLARDNGGDCCGACLAKDRDPASRAPAVPAEFWADRRMQEALASWHMGRLVAAYRAHPYHGRALPQDVVARWLGITQARLSRIEHGPPIKDLDKLIDWARALGIPERLLWFRLPENSPAASPDAVALLPPVASSLESGWGAEGWTVAGAPPHLATDTLQKLSERALIMAAAHESSEHAGRAETTNVGETTLEQLDADVYRIANGYVHAPPIPMVVEMLRVRRRVYRLLEGHQKPADSAHLYLLAGTLCGLLANASNDLGHHDAASEQARAAWAYAEISDHNGLRAWTRGMQALIEYWSDRPRQAARLAQGALRYADSDTAKIRLFNIEARMWSRLGDLDETNRCILAAEQTRGSDRRDDLHDEIGGVFGFNEAKSHYYAGATYIHLGQADPALDAARRAIDLYANGPAEQRSYGAEALTRIDAAVASVMKGTLDRAIDVLEPVLALSVDKRIAQLDERLTDVRHQMARSSFHDAHEAQDLDERIEEFCSVNAVSELPAGGSHQ